MSRTSKAQLALDYQTGFRDTWRDIPNHARPLQRPFLHWWYADVSSGAAAGCRAALKLYAQLGRRKALRLDADAAWARLRERKVKARSGEARLTP